MRIGHGYDAHRFVSGRDLMLGGVKIPSEYGLDGHSDADVLIHAICDALLGAAGDRDISYHFPDKDDVYKDIASVKLLARVADLLAVKGYTVSNLDCTVIAEYPRLSPDIEKMEVVPLFEKAVDCHGAVDATGNQNGYFHFRNGKEK